MGGLKSVLWSILLWILWITTVVGFQCPARCTCVEQTVRCTRQQLQHVPEFPDETTIIDLRYNHIKEVASKAFVGKSQLHTIFLNENQIAEIHPGAFVDLPSLKYLYLNKNRISRIEKDAFTSLNKLQSLYLQFNEIGQLSGETFASIPRLERLFLYNNQLTTLPEGLLESLKYLKQLRLDGNAFSCDCSLVWLVKFLKSNRIDVKISANCASPGNLAGKNIALLKESDFKCRVPILMTTPNDMKINMGDKAILPCHAVGDPEPEITWMVNSSKLNVPENDDSNYKILPNGSLKIEKVSVNDLGDYECMAQNIVGSVLSRPARMAMEETSSMQNDEAVQPENSDKNSPKLAFKTVPQNTVVRVNESIILHCETEGPRPVQIVWYLNAKKLFQSSYKQQILSNGTLVIRQAETTNAGNYKCEASNGQERINAVASVRVVEPPKLIATPSDQTLSPGESFILHCFATGNPVPEIRWSFNGQPVVETNRIYLESQNTELHGEHVKVSESGDYRCVAENIHGSVSASAKIEVQSSSSPPRLIFEPYDMDAIQGSTIEMPCKAQSDQIAEVKWKKDGRTLFTIDRVRIAKSGSLFISNVTLVDNGRYECSITNQYGRATASGLLTVKVNDDHAPGEKFIRKAFADAAKEIDGAINNTVSALFSTKPKSEQSINHGDMFRIFRFPNQPARELARAAEIYERTLFNIRKHVEAGHTMTAEKTEFNYTEVLSSEYLDLIASLSGCTSHRLMPNCSDTCFNQKYRTIDGTCNNLANPTWGASLTGFRRILNPIYEDEFTMPVGWKKEKLYNGFKLPSTRLVSTSLISTESITSDSEITHMVMQWGQFLDHDLDHALPSVSSESFDGVDCKKTCEFSAPCYPIQIPDNDPRVQNRRCLDFVRSSAICGSGQTSILFGTVQPREQINQLTSFLDGSQVYGYSKEFANELRNLTADDGTLRHGIEFPGQKQLLPFAAPTDGIDCRREIEESNVNCFTAGDIRVNEQVGLLAMHTIWFREHNRLAWELKENNPHWDSDTLYQEARKIVGAQMQHITYQHWLPLIVGSEGLKMLGDYKGYNPNTNPSISNEFATAALRFGHSLINPILHRLDKNYEPIAQGHLPLHRAFFSPWRLVYEGGVDPLMRGLITVAAKLKKPTQNLNTELTEKLFFSAHAVALDLAAINVQRSRDHAIPSYNEYRRFCNLSFANSFEDLKEEISSEEVRKTLEKVYGHVSNVDIWVGGILEDQVEGGKVGPLFRCLLVDQFKRLRDGDRFWYENPSVFKPEQLVQIKQASIGRVLCDNGDNITEVTDNVFILPQKQNGYKKCDLIPKIDLRMWMDCTGCTPRPQFGGELLRRSRSRRSITNETLGKENEDENWIDMNDERIEGLEAMIAGFQKTLKQMRKKIKNLEESCGTNNNKHNKHGHCIDSKGLKRLNNEIWNENDCTKCECKHKQVNCITEKCPPLDNCPKGPVPTPGKCCPSCN